MAYASRITLDFDSYIPAMEFKAVRAWHELKREADEVEARVSRSGTGIHLVAWFEERLTDDQKFALRRHLSDDAHRIRMDEMRGAVGHTTNVLWEDDTDFENVYDALDHIRETTTDPQAVVKPGYQRRRAPRR